MFVDRFSEMSSLEREYARSEAAFVVVYGRRRVGKTRLISEFIKGKRALYYLATEESEAQNLASFKDMAAAFLESALLREAAVERWETVFEEIAKASQQGERIIIVIDEFQYIGRSNPAFPSVLQRIWDARLKHCDVMLVLSGSLVSLMKSQVLSYDSPLYGRRTAQMNLQQIPFKYYGNFFPDKDSRELVEFYAVTGGVPKYIELFEDAGDVYDAVSRNVLNRNGFLYSEPYFLLQKEVSEVGTYFSIIKAIAMGNSRPSEIASALQAKQTSLSRHLTTLIELGLIRREVPVTESNPEKSKRSVYRIDDNFLRFWFRFVQPNASYIELGHPEVVEATVRANLTDGHTAYVYEDVCRQMMWELAAQGAWGCRPEKVGRWWDKESEIDIVALSESGRSAVFAECKFWKGPVGVNVLRDLKQKADRVGWRKNERSESFVLFSMGGFTGELHDLAKTERNVLLVEGIGPFAS